MFNRMRYFNKLNNRFNVLKKIVVDSINRNKDNLLVKRLIYVTSILAIVVLFMIITPNSVESKINLVSHADLEVDRFISEYYQSDFTGVGSGDIDSENTELLNGLTVTHYLIQQGDTLGKIAKDNKISLGTLISYNNIRDCKRLLPGTELNIPNLDGVLYKVKDGDTLASIAKAYNVGINNILDGNNLTSDILTKGTQIFIPGGKLSEYELKLATGNLVIWPCSGRITSYFGWRKDPFTGMRSYHPALDVANYRGSIIKAAMSGKIILVDYRPKGYGRHIIIKHSNGLQTLYGHLDKSYVRTGQWVDQGQVIGEMGSTGRSTGPHLHFGIYKNHIPVNPLSYLSGK